MLKPKLTNEPPENLKGAYVRKGEEWVLDTLADDHPVVAHNKTLVAEKSTVETELNSLKADKANLERERDDFKTKAVPAGYRTVPKADAELLDAIKPLNLSKDELATLKTENEQFKAKEAEQAARANLTKAFEFAGVKNVDQAMNLKAADNLQIEWKTVDNVSKPYLVGEKDGQRSETLFDENFVKETSGFKDFAPVLYGEEKRGFQFSGEGGKDAPKNEWEQIRQDARESQKGAAALNAAEMFTPLGGSAPPAAATAAK